MTYHFQFRWKYASEIQMDHSLEFFALNCTCQFKDRIFLVRNDLNKDVVIRNAPESPRVSLAAPFIPCQVAAPGIKIRSTRIENKSSSILARSGSLQRRNSLIEFRRVQVKARKGWGELYVPTILITSVGERKGRQGWRCGNRRVGRDGIQRRQ